MADLLGRVQSDWMEQDVRRLYRMFNSLINRVVAALSRKYGEYHESVNSVVYTEFMMLLTKYKRDKGSNITVWMDRLLYHKSERSLSSFLFAGSPGYLVGEQKFAKKIDGERIRVHTLVPQNSPDGCISNAVGEENVAFSKAHHDRCDDKLRIIDMLQCVRTAMGEQAVDVVVLSWYLDFSQPEVASIVGLTQSRVSQLLAAAASLIKSKAGEL